MRIIAELMICAVVLAHGHAQNPVVTATGNLLVQWQPSYGLPQQVSQPVIGTSTVVHVSGVGTASLTVGATTVLTLNAESPPYPWSGMWSHAAGNVVVSYAATAPVAGVLRLQMAPACFMSNPTIDVDDDGIVEMDLSTTTPYVDVPVVLGTRPVPVRIVAATVNFGGAVCTYAPTIQFLPQPANLTTVQPPCGPVLGASLRTATTAAGQLTLRVDGMAGIAGVLFVGSVPTPPSPGCGQAANVDATLLLAPTANGLDVPVALSPSLLGSYVLQYVELVLPFQLRWSNDVRLVLP
jgi:hypothetical protein